MPTLNGFWASPPYANIDIDPLRGVAHLEHPSTGLGILILMVTVEIHFHAQIP